MARYDDTGLRHLLDKVFKPRTKQDKEFSKNRRVKNKQRASKRNRKQHGRTK